jgi:adenosylmethionine-8-amino-7-oxononanoate aminotransferase
LPLSVVLVRDEIYQAFWFDDAARSFLHSHSYSGNALACRAAWAVLERFEHDDVLARNVQLSAPLSQAWHALQGDDRLCHVRQQGMVWAFDVKPEIPDFSERFHQAARSRELLIRPIGQTVYLMPPYLLKPDDYAWAAKQTLASLQDVLNA